MRRGELKQETYTTEYVENYHCNWSPTSPKFKNLQGNTFGDLKVIKLHKRVDPHTFWFCSCSCGSNISLNTNQLNRGSNSCSKCSFSRMGERCSTPLEDKLAEVKSTHPNYQLINSFGNKPKGYWFWYCPDCITGFYHRIDHVKGKAEVCRCSGKFVRWTQQLREHQIKEICLERNLKFLGWKDTYTRATSRFFLKCNKHPHFESNVNNFTKSSANYGCPYCSFEKPTKEKHGLEKFILDGNKVHEGKFNYSQYTYTDSRTPSTVQCLVCNDFFEVSYDNHVNKKRGCPSCKGKNQTFSYLLLIKDGEIPLAVKFGITTNLAQRIAEHVKGCPSTIEILHTWEFPNSSSCKLAEKTVKKIIDRTYLNKIDFPTGNTETTHVNEITNIINIFESFGGIKIV